MEPNFAFFASAVVTLVITLLGLNALMTCARELGAIRKHLDKLTPEALLALKTGRRANHSD